MERNQALNLKPGDLIRHRRNKSIYSVDNIDIKNRVEEHIKYFEKVWR